MEDKRRNPNKKPDVPAKKRVKQEDGTPLPKGVVNRNAYNDYVILQQHPLLNDDRVYQTSNPNLKIDLATPINHVRRMSADLPEQEQKDIFAQTSAVKALLGKLSFLKQSTYGMVRGNFIEDNGFLDPRKTELIELFGRFHTIEEVHQLINQQWGLEVSISTVRAFKTKNLDKVTELQEKYKRDYSHVRLGYKRARLDELTYLYTKRKEIFEGNPTAENHRLMLTTLEQIRKECEGDELKVSFEGNLNINATINVHIQNDLMQKLSIKDIVLSRLCGKYGVNNQLLLYRLHRSFYAKFVGTQKADNDLLGDEMIYPSQHVYDFEKIKRQNQLLEIEEAKIVEEDVKVEESKKDPGAILKKALQEKIKQKQEALNKSRENITTKKP